MSVFLKCKPWNKYVNSWHSSANASVVRFDRFGCFVYLKYFMSLFTSKSFESKSLIKFEK